jgi:L-asparaginase
MPLKRVYVAYTGGTIGMRRKGSVYEPEPGYLGEQLSRMPEMASDTIPEIEVAESVPLLDSSDITPSHWERIARDIQGHQDFDGFVVLHGTDTMAYTASALSFMLEGLARPVIVTGSQIPLSEPRSDARDNLIDALTIAGHHEVVIPEVALLFNGLLLRGNRATKTSADGLDAFESPNYRPLGRGGIQLTLHKNRIREVAPGGLRVAQLEAVHVAALRLFPGIEPRVLSEILRKPMQGIVLEAFGVGNAPTDSGLAEAIREATARGVVVVVCTQCLRGSVNLGTYAAGSALADAGAIAGHDMTMEAAMTKMYWLFGQGLAPDVVKEKMGQDLRGEITLPDDPRRTIL